MDPLSITVSVITLLGACSSIAKTFERVRKLRNVPEILYALNNEIEDLRLTLLDIHERREEFFQNDPTKLKSKDWRLFKQCHGLLEGTWAKVHEAETIINSNLRRPGCNSISRLDNLMVLRRHGRLDELRVHLREAKQNIQSLWGQLDRRNLAHMQIQVARISETSSEIQTQLLKYNGIHPDDHQRIEGKVDRLLENSHLLDDHQRIESKIDKLLEMQEVLSLLVKQGLNMNTLGKERIDIMLKRVPYLQGAVDRRCRCRDENRSFNYVRNSLLGNLFFGYAATPMFSKHRRGCQYNFQAEMVLVYSFPTWFLSYALALRARYDWRLQCSISVRPVLPYYHLAWKLIESSDIEGLKDLLSSRQISLEGRDGNGNGLLHAALLLGKLDLVAFLLKIGANSKAESNGGRTPYHYAWDRILYGNEESNYKLMSLFPDPDFDELYEFSALHKVILGLEAESTSEAVNTNALIINDGDRFGRTALSWAAGRRDQETIELLLSRQAHVDQSNHMGSSPLIIAATSGDKECIKILLRAGANATLKNQLGATALHYVVQHTEQYGDNLQILESLIDAGTNINEQCIFGTPLCIAAEHGSLEQVNFLMSRGADQNIRESLGHNPLSIAILSGQHSISKALLDRNGDHTGSILDFSTFMHLIARQADTESLQILLNYRLKPRNINTKNLEGHTPIEVAFKRKDVDAQWRDLFTQFLKSIDEDIPPQNQESELAEYSVEWPRATAPGRAAVFESVDGENSSCQTAVQSESSDDEFVDAMQVMEIPDPERTSQIETSRSQGIRRRCSI